MNNLIGGVALNMASETNVAARSCLTILLDFFAQVIDTYDTDNNKAVDLVYLDF